MNMAPTRVLKAAHLDGTQQCRRVAFTELSNEPHERARFQPLDFNKAAMSNVETPALLAQCSDAETGSSLPAAQAALPAALNELQTRHDRWLEQFQHETVKLGIAIAERLLRRTLAVDPKAVADLMRTALGWAVGAEHVRVRCHPDDCDVIEQTAASQRSDQPHDIAFVRDDTIARGGCVVETTQGVIDARLETMLDRIAEELLSDAG
jgi:flagellar biosynthesis/type III secretory pathway protein FliH